MPDIFGRVKQQVTHGWTSDAVTLTFANPNNKPIFVQNIRYNYQQPVSRIYDLGDPKTIAMVSPRPQGGMAIGHIMADWATTKAFLQSHSDVCNPQAITVNYNRGQQGGKCGGVASSVNFDDCVITGITMAVSVDNYLLTNDTELVFASMEAA